MRYQSENFTLDTDDYRLTRNGVNHPVEPQVFDLLVYLINHRNRVVTRDELLEHLWKGRIVSDSAINARLKEARKAVGDSGRQQRVIKTLHRRGYQFIAEVTVTAADKKQSDTVRGNSDLRREKPSIAVLRFKDLSKDSGQAYFADGMSANVCSRLSRIRSLLVKSGMECELGAATLVEIAADLEVKYVLSGSVQREADHVRVFVELADGSSGDIQWSEHFDRQGKDVINIQDDIATEITGTLWSNRGTIREAERDRLSRKPTSDFNAFDYILRGIYYKEQYHAESLKQAHECFDHAIELDPESAEAWGWKGWVYLLERWLDSGKDSEAALENARVAAKKSIAIDAYSEIGHWTMAEVCFESSDFYRGHSELDKAMDINPNNPDLMVHKGCQMCVEGQIEQGLQLIDQGMTFNKHYPQWYFWHLGIALFAAHRWRDCIDSITRMDDQNRGTLIFLAVSYVQVENTAEAEACFSEMLRLDPQVDLGEIEKTHSFFAADTLHLLIESIRTLKTANKAKSRLRVV